MSTLVLTGAASGIGLAAATQLGEQGHRVVALCRSVERARAALGEEVTIVPVDLASVASIRTAAAQVARKVESIDGLINIGGVCLSGTAPASPDGLELQLAINHVAPFVLIALLSDRIRPGGRVVNVSSRMHRRVGAEAVTLSANGWSGLRGYSRSKLALTLASAAWASRLAAQNVAVLCVDPGGVATGIYRNMSWPVRAATRLFLRSPESAAAELVAAAIAPMDGFGTGAYLRRGRPIQPSACARDPHFAEQIFADTEQLVANLSSPRTS